MSQNGRNRLTKASQNEPIILTFETAQQFWARVAELLAP